MFSQTLIDFINHDDTQSDVTLALFDALSEKRLDFSRAEQVDVNESYQLVYRTPGKAARQILRPGKLPALVLPGFNFADHQLEKFTNEFKTWFSEDGEYYPVVVSGSEILSSYDTDNYSRSDDHHCSSPLWDSCMNDDIGYLGMYAQNPACQLVRLINRHDGGIVARALLWQTQEGVKLMDRVYFSKPLMRDRLLRWAKDQGYHQKQQQNYENKVGLLSAKGEKEDITLTVQLDTIPSMFPYVDTFTYLLPDKKLLTNVKPRRAEWYYELTKTDGEFSEHHPVEAVYSDYENREIDKRHAVWCDYVDSWISDHNTCRIDGVVYPDNHPDIVGAYTKSDLSSYSRAYRLRSQCQQDDNGTWFEIGHPWFLLRHASDQWAHYDNIARFERVTNAYGEEGLFYSDWNQGGLLPLDAQILRTVTGTGFVEGDPDFGYFYGASGYGFEMTGWYKRSSAENMSRAIEMPVGMSHQAAKLAVEMLDEADQRVRFEAQAAITRQIQDITGSEAIYLDEITGEMVLAMSQAQRQQLYELVVSLHLPTTEPDFHDVYPYDNNIAQTEIFNQASWDRYMAYDSGYGSTPTYQKYVTYAIELRRKHFAARFMVEARNQSAGQLTLEQVLYPSF